MINQRDIAQAAGVSVATVSTVLANKSASGRISSTTASRVEQVARRMGYRPNLTARGLRTNKHYTIGLLFFNLSELLYGELLTELHVRLTRHRYAGVSAFWNTDDEAVAAFQSVISRGIDGIITCHHNLSLAPDGIPIVTFESRSQERDCVYRDGQGAVRKALLHLLELGHRRFGMVT